MLVKEKQTTPLIRLQQLLETSLIKLYNSKTMEPLLAKSTARISPVTEQR
jgi:hypothetical protein